MLNLEKHRVQRQIPQNLRLKYLFIKKICHTLDNGFEIPIIKYRIGLDPILGLFIGYGDAVSFAISLYTLYLMSSFKVPKKILFVMFLDLVLDFIVGIIPIFGQGLDFFNKANMRNWKRFSELFYEEL